MQSKRKQPLAYSFVAVDPSIVSMGFAAFVPNLIMPYSWGLIKVPTKLKKADSLVRSRYQCNELFNRIRKIHDENPDYVYPNIFCEQPQFFNSNKGMASARSQSINKLMHLVGMINQKSYEEFKKFHPVGINDWKGQLSKKGVEFRIRKILKNDELVDEFKNDIMDAVGIGLYIKGMF